VLDGEVVKLDENGRPQFYDLMRRRGPFAFVAFDVLVLNGKDVRKLVLTHRKQLLRLIVPRRSSSVCMLSTSQTEAARSSPRSALTISKESLQSTARAPTAPTSRGSGSRSER
jgi:ATP-dependent DNA ligase